MQQALDILKRYWGYDSFRPVQDDIIASVLAGRDTLGLMPTGGGKSITFQVPAMVFDGLTVVVTPLISLMKDQVDNLAEAGIRAVYLHAGLSRREHRLAIDRCRLGKVKILYVSPEKLRSETFMADIRTFNVSLIVVDEAHCISQWGYDFRPSYLKIVALRHAVPSAPVLALTASATPEVVEDIMRSLEFRERNLFSRSFARDNISYLVRYTEYKEALVTKILRNTAGSAIVYVRSRRRTREIAEMLCADGITAEYYHAGLDPEEKNERQNRWKNDTTRVMVATNAFGMGIDKPDVRVVIHIDPPGSLEEYYQEAGRAGRDGRGSYAVLIASKHDKGLMTRRLSEAFPPKPQITKIYEHLGCFFDVSIGGGFNRLYEFNLNKFCQRFELNPTITRNALQLLTRAGYIEYVDEVSTRSRVMILLDKHELYDLRLDSMTDRVLQLLLRTYPGLFSDYQYISETLLAGRLGVTDDSIYQSMLALTRAHVLHYIPRTSTPYILYTTSREDNRYIQLPLSVYEHQRERMKNRIEAMKRFTYGSDTCRVTTMLRYFGENPTADCGKCDICRERRKSSNAANEADIRRSVIYLASQPGGHSVDYIVSSISAPREKTLSVIRQLADNEEITMQGLKIFKK